MAKSELDPRRFALAAGMLWAAVLFLWSWFIMLAGINWGMAFVNLFRTLYIGYSITVLGSVIGAVWAFVDAFVFFYIFAYLYNWLGDKL